ncbi:hypothetical protein N7524_002825 [Penicillium chrysogenum]|nr:hypothetical protein N7524_002825 [Penicillium chrysogenum]
MDDTPVNIIPQAWCFIWRCERLEQILISMKEITTSFIPQQRLHVLRIDLNHLDIATGITSPSVTRYFMPRTNTPRIEKIREDPSWDWFLSQRGSFGKGTYRANHLLRRVFMDYQDSSIPEFWPRELHEAESEEKENNQDSTAQESSGQLDNTGGDRENNEDDKTHDKEVNKGEEINSDKAKEGEIIGPKKTDESDEDGDKIEESGGDNCNPSDESQNKNEKRDKEADVDHEMVISKALDRDIRNYRTNDWSVYWHQRLYDLDLPHNVHGISIARSMELNHPHKCHAWALVDVILCGHERPSTAELTALASWGLRGMFRQLESLANGIKPEDVHKLSEVFPCSIKDAVLVCYTATLMVDFKFNLPRS